MTETPCNSNSPSSFRCRSKNCTTCPYIEHGCNEYTFPLSMLFTWFNVNYVIFSMTRKPNIAFKTVLMNTDALYSIPLVVISRPQSQNTFLAITIHTIHMLLIPMEKLINQRNSFTDECWYWPAEISLKDTSSCCFTSHAAVYLTFTNILKSILTDHNLL